MSKQKAIDPPEFIEATQVTKLSNLTLPSVFNDSSDSKEESEPEKDKPEEEKELQLPNFSQEVQNLRNPAHLQRKQIELEKTCLSGIPDEMQ